MNLGKQFAEIHHLINSAKAKAFRIVNTELINLYWEIGKYISNKIANEEWGKGIVTNLAKYLKESEPELKGFSSQNLWRMKQFYEAYKDLPKLSTLLREIPWSHNMTILSSSKTIEEREFYIRLTIKERLSKKEHEKPSVGLILCKSKDNEIVEYALSRSVSPTLISQYETKLIDKKLLEEKLDEFFELGKDDE